MKTFFKTIRMGLLATTLICGVAQAETDWPQFRGPDATGVVAGDRTHPPLSWSAEENVAWKVDIPGRGWSSPIVWGNRVFVTTVRNLGESEPPKKGLYFGGNRPEPPESVHQWIVLCLDLESGAVLWERQVHEAQPKTSIHVKNSFASETPVTDGTRVYALFGGLGIYCFDFDGNQIWSHAIEPRKTRYGWGTAASPVLHGDHIFLVDDNDESSYLMSLDKETGAVAWRVDRDEASNWSTPFVWQNRERTEIVTLGTGRVRSYDLNGEELWSLSGMSSITIATPYTYQDRLIISSGYVGDQQRPLYSIRAGASGDISLSDDETSNEYIAWCQPKGGPYNPTTLALDGTIYVLLDFGFFLAFDAADGSVVYPKTRIPDGRAFTASPWSYGDRIFCLNEDGDTFVIEPGDEFKVAHVNSLADDDMGMATPAIAGDRLLLRTSARLYCIRDQAR